MSVPSEKLVLILGATSDIGRAVARSFAAEGWAVTLAARDPDALARDVQDLSVRSRSRVNALAFDVLATDRFATVVDGLPRLPDAVVCMVGLLGDQPRAEKDLGHAALIMRSNFEGPALVLGLLAERFATRGSGTLVGVSSVAGERGRMSNYVYGSAKAGFTAFLSGLRNRCAKRGVRVVTVKPGFVRTRMTAGMKLPGALTAEPDEVARAILKAVTGRGDVIYTRPVWRLIMLIIRTIPEPVFKKLSL